MSKKWLEENKDEAVSGIDAVILDMLRSLSNPTHIQVLSAIERTPRRFSELKGELGFHQQLLTRDLNDLKEFGLAMQEDSIYRITSFGAHVLKVYRDFSAQARERTK